MARSVDPPPLHTYLHKPKREEALRLPLRAEVEGLAPVLYERGECAVVQVPVKVDVGLPWKQSKW